jgi:rhodanese-related sulfurtransferase
MCARRMIRKYMKALFALITSLFTFLVAPAQVQSSAYDLTLKALLTHSVPEVSVSQVKEMKNSILLDAREFNEYTVSHIQDAVYVGYDQFEIGRLNSINKNQKIIVYCSVGYRSEKISEKLKQTGFTDVSNLYGGIFEWINQGNPVVNENGKVTENIHAYNEIWGVWLTKGVKVYDTK